MPSAVSIFPNQKGTSILKKEVLQYFPVGAKFFQTLYFLHPLALGGGLKLARLHKKEFKYDFFHTHILLC